VTEHQHFVTTPDGLKLFVREYLPDEAFERTLLFIHGACEHGGRYSAFATAATQAGWRVLIPDLRGHGVSDGVRVHVHHFDQYLRDIDQIYRHFTLNASHTAIIGHSMGGLVAARWLQVDSGRVFAACLLSPYLGLKIRVDRFSWIAGQVLLRIWPWFRFRSRVRSADLSVDQEYLAARRKDCLIVPSVTAGWFFAVQEALRQVHTEASRISLPLLMLQGEQDHVTDPEAAKAWFSQTSSTDKSLDLIADGLHELLQGRNREPTFQWILDWLQRHAPQMPQHAGR